MGSLMLTLDDYIFPFTNTKGDTINQDKLGKLFGKRVFVFGHLTPVKIEGSESWSGYWPTLYPEPREGIMCGIRVIKEGKKSSSIGIGASKSGKFVQESTKRVALVAINNRDTLRVEPSMIAVSREDSAEYLQALGLVDNL